ncbi:hypothetical protein CBS147311_6110 [Penicillium roqueforti]|nr:hypothetical protein CBS147311_6110 [Penicillium roqueforti]
MGIACFGSSRRKRAKIFKVFLEEYDKAADIGILERETIHFVGFEDPEFFKPKGRADNNILAIYGLAKPCNDWSWRRDIDTSGWTF